MGLRRSLQGIGSASAVIFGVLVCSNASAEEVVLGTAGGPSAVEQAACPAALRLRAVQFDPNHAERSFVVFAGSSLRAPPLRQGARVGAYAVERIERGAAVLATQSQRCSVRLRSLPLDGDRELRAISVEAVRSGLRARSTAAASTVASAQPSAPAKQPALAERSVASAPVPSSAKPAASVAARASAKQAPLVAASSLASAPVPTSSKRPALVATR